MAPTFCTVSEINCFTAFKDGLWLSSISTVCKLLVTSISIFELTVKLFDCREISSPWKLKLLGSLLISLNCSSPCGTLRDLGLCLPPGEPDSVAFLPDCLLGLLESDGGAGGRDRFSNSNFFCCNLGLTDPECFTELCLFSFGSC